MIDIRLTLHIQKLARIGGQAFDIAPLPFGINRVKGERGFARARQPGDHHQFVARNIDVDVFQVVLARAAHFDEFLIRHIRPRHSTHI